MTTLTQRMREELVRRNFTNSTIATRRYVQHVLPRGFVRIRQYRYLASHSRTASLALARTLLAATPPPQPKIAAGDHADSDPPWRCPVCGGPMQLGPNLTAAQLARQCSFFDSS